MGKALDIQAIGSQTRAAVDAILKREWDCPPCISRGRATDTTVLPGFVCLGGHGIDGVVTYHIVGDACEVVTLNSFDENKGIGTALVAAVAGAARAAGCRRLWLVTTNDDINAIRFYQLKGFDWVATHLNAMDAARQLKPSIPMTGMHGIPLKHEVEFEMLL